MMERIQFEGEEAFVAEAIGLAEEGFDFVVDAFHASVADAVLPPGEDAAGVAQQGLAQLLHLAHPRRHRPGNRRVDQPRLRPQTLSPANHANQRESDSNRANLILLHRTDQNLD